LPAATPVESTATAPPTAAPSDSTATGVPPAAPLATPHTPTATASAPAPLPPPPATALTPPPTPLTSIRNKISAGDLLSAESVLDVWRTQHGEDGLYLVGLSWLARGALLTGDNAKAKRYADEVRARCADSLSRGVKLEESHEVEIALGAALEVEAQRLARLNGDRYAASFLQNELAKTPGPVAYRSRLQKRINMLTLVGSPAPELVVEDSLGGSPPTLAALRGKPVVLFLWAESCGDCRAQEASLARVKQRYRDELEVVPVTRYYDDIAERATEKARVDSVWNTAYQDMGKTPIILSTASMERYGVSSTPTFVFVDRKGIVRAYTPTRLSTAELENKIAVILRR
jgi:thiol-disulfide isomerase/thioredoxin